LLTVGAVRYLDRGNLPFNKEIVDFNRKKIAERERAQGRKVDYESVINDLYSISRGSLVNRGRLTE
jgi:methylaspartate mutase epsilon subunit